MSPDDQQMSKYEKYKHLKANVRRRRIGYGLFILFALIVFAASIVDIIFLLEEDWNAEQVGNFGLIEVAVYAAYAIMFIWGIFLLLSRSQHLEELRQLRELEHAFLTCDTCNTVFQFGELRLGTRKKVGFSCPVCGDYSALPLPGAAQVRRVLPAGQLNEERYYCHNCDEHLAVSTFNVRPQRVQFQACPNCEVSGLITLSGEARPATT